MAVDAQTIREVFSGFNSMQASLGLLPGGSPQGQSAFPTPTLPQIKTPGEFAQMVTQQASGQYMATQQAVQQAMRQTPMNAPAQMAGPAAQFVAEYQARLGDIRSNYVNPYTAQFIGGRGGGGFSGSGGLPGFGAGFGSPGGMGAPYLPDPIYQTPVSMGVFRPQFAPPPPIPLARVMPLIQTPFTAQVPSPLFQTPMQFAHHQAAINDDTRWGAVMAGIPTAARMGAGGMGAYGGMALGGYWGGRLAGPMGATIGGIGGLVAGGLAGFGPIGRGVENFTQWAQSPITTTRAFGRQIESMSRNWVVGGPQLSELGQGLSLPGSLDVVNRMQRGVSGGAFGDFNMRDMMRMTGMAGQAGMLDMAQDSSQIVSTMRKVARNVQAFMQIANEPDVQRAMQTLSQMRNLGLNMPETTATLSAGKYLAKMAGTTFQDLYHTAGMPGAMTFQQLGMSGGLGLNVGMAAGAFARQAVAAGSYTPAQLAMGGGQRGIQQTLTEMSGAGLGLNFPLLSMLTRDSSGKLAIDRGRAVDITTGGVALDTQAIHGASSVGRLGGAGVITELSTRLNELRDELGRKLGPHGSMLMTMSQASQLQKAVPGLTFGSALNMMGLAPEQARSIELMGQSEGFWGGLRQGNETRIREARTAEAERIKAEESRYTPWGKVKDWWSQDFTAPIRKWGRGVVENVSGWWGERQERQRALEEGAIYIPKAESIFHNAAIDSAAERARRRGGTNLIVGAEAEGMTTRQRVVGGIQAAASLAMLGIGGGGYRIGATIAGNMGLNMVRSAAAEESINAAVRRAQGGFGGWWEGSGFGADLMGAYSGDYTEDGRDISRMGSTIDAAREMGQGDAIRLQNATRREYTARTGGQGVDYDTMRRKMRDIIGGIARDEGTGLFAKGMGADELRRRVFEKLGRQDQKTLAGLDQVYDTMSQAAIREAYQLGDKQTKAGIERWRTGAKEVDTAFAANTGQALQNKLEEVFEQKIYSKAGVTDKEEKEALSTYLATTTDPEELLMRQAVAAYAQGDKSALANLEDRWGKTPEGRKKYDRLYQKVVVDEKFLDRGKDDAAIRAFAKLNEKTKWESLDERVAKLKAMGDTQREGTQIDIFNKGLTEVAGTTGALASVGRTGASNIDSYVNALQNMSTKDVDTLKDPAAKRAAQAFKNAKGDAERRGAAADFMEAVYNAGKGKKDGQRVGGKGTGSSTEKTVKEEQDWANKTQAQINEEFGSSVTKLEKAAEQLSYAAKKMAGEHPAEPQPD